MVESIRPYQNPSQNSHDELAQRADLEIAWLNEAAVVVSGKGATVTDTFALPPGTRDDAPMPNWTEGQITNVRSIGQRMGYGARETVPSSVRGGVRFIEGGKIWKILAETKALAEEQDFNTIIFGGSPNRPLPEDERTFLDKHLELEEVTPEGTTEYDGALLIAKFAVAKTLHEEVLHFGYEISEGNLLIRRSTGQLVQIGQTSLAQNVQLLRIDREDYKNDAGEDKYRYQPDTTRVMTLVSEILSAQGIKKDSVALITSNTYASRVVAAWRAGLSHSRQFDVAMYGRDVLTNMGAPVPDDWPLNQIPGDLRVRYEELIQLKDELRKTS